MTYRPRLLFTVAISTSLGLACHRETAPASSTDAASGSVAGTSSVVIALPPDPPIEAHSVEVPGDVPVFAVAGRRGAKERLVFLHGACTHGLGYLQAFQLAAAKRANAIALQGDVPCGGGMRWYTWDLAKQDARIAAAFRATGDDKPLTDVIIAGFSQGGAIAEQLVAKWPERYGRAILIGSPVTPSGSRLARARGIVTMSGEYDNPSKMREGAASVKAAGVPATFILIPKAHHGSLGVAVGDSERLMEEALAWLDAHARSAP